MACGSMGAPMAAPAQTPAAMPTGHNGGCGAGGAADPTSATEQSAAFEQLFNQLDKNNNGSIERQELMDFLQGSIMENGMRNQMGSDQQETVNGKTPTSQAANAPEAGPAGPAYGEDKTHGAHGAHGSMEGIGGDAAMGGSCAGPAAAPVAPAMCGAA